MLPQVSSDQAFSPHSALLYTPLSWHLALKSAEVGGWVVLSEREGGSLSISTAVPFSGRNGRVRRGREGPVGDRKTSALLLHWC